MSDRGFLFLFSVLMIAGSGAAIAYLIATGQAATVDGLFLVLMAGLVALCFVLYLAYLIRRAMESSKPAAKSAKATSAATTTTTNPATAQ